MKQIVDIVNFNADASCLDSSRWLDALKGGVHSEMCRWLSLYLRFVRPVVIGFTGATLADIARFNPESLDMIRENPNIFQVLLRPFSHDIALLRTQAGFLYNLRLGRQIIEKYFPDALPIFLPPEFMLTNEQVFLLEREGIGATMINPERFLGVITDSPCQPYALQGVFGKQITCIPVAGEMTSSYLSALHGYEPDCWVEAICKRSDPVVWSWRDGESFLLMPDGLEREECWLSHEASRVFRIPLKAEAYELRPRCISEMDSYYPVHSFTAWMREFRMLGFLSRLGESERRIARFGKAELALWLNLINSDVLSSVEKLSPSIRLCLTPDALPEDFVIQRTCRAFEAEEWLMILEDFSEPFFRERVLDSDRPHMKKLQARYFWLNQFGSGNEH